MAKALKKVKLPADSELALVLKDASTRGRPVVVDTGEAVYSLSVGAVTTSLTPEEIARSKEGILKAAGRWREIIDAEAFKAYISERRRTSSRPAWRGEPLGTPGGSPAQSATLERGDPGYCDVPGFCKAATLEEIRKHGHVLTPGCYVGTEAQEDAARAAG